MKMIRLLSIILVVLTLSSIQCQMDFNTFCSSEVTVPGSLSVNADDEFEIDLYETKFLPDDRILLEIKQKGSNAGIFEFVVRAFDYEGNVVGRFDDDPVGKLNLKHHPCANGASAIYVDKSEGAERTGYSKIPLAWRASGIGQNVEEVFFRADIISNQEVFRVRSAPLKRRTAANYIPPEFQSINIDHCGDTQGCLIVPQNCNNKDKCEYALSWQVLDADRAKFHILARAKSFTGVGFSKDEKRGDDQVVLCIRDAYNHIHVRNMFYDVQTPQYISPERPLYGLQDTDAFYNGTHIACSFIRRLSDSPRDGEKTRLVNLKEPHYMYPIYSDQNTQQGVRIPTENIPIVNNHPINFERAIWPKSHSRAGSFLAKIHAILNIIAWILLASAGLLVARYFDIIWPEYEYDRRIVPDNNGVATVEKLRRRRRVSYFSIFQPIITTVAILTWIAFFAILFELDWRWTSGTHHMWHSILGLIVLICAFLAPLLGFLRPRPRTKPYCVWYWIHWLVVTLATCLAVPVIFLGMDNPRLDLWTWCSWLLFGWCIFHFIVQLIFEIHACCYSKRDYENFEDVDSYPEKNPDRRVRRERIPGETWKPSLLSIYIFVTLVVVIILILAVIFYQGY